MRYKLLFLCRPLQNSSARLPILIFAHLRKPEPRQLIFGISNWKFLSFMSVAEARYQTNLDKAKRSRELRERLRKSKINYNTKFMKNMITKRSRS